MEKYQVLKKIGSGTYGSAYLVHLKANPQLQYVLKVIRITGASPKERAAAHQEVKLLAQLDHPFVLGYTESFIYKGEHLCIVTEYCESGDLYTYLKRQKQILPEKQVLEWFVEMALAIEYVHERNVLHRDLKSQNIFLTREGHVALGDFGIARVLNSPLEMAQTVIGTPYYMSPEIMRSKPYDFKSDIWALGCILYEITTLKHAFDAQDMNGLVMKILRGKIMPIHPSYSDDLKKLIAAMLNKTPRLRPSMEQILSQPFLQPTLEVVRQKAMLIKRARALGVSKFRAHSSSLSTSPERSLAHLAHHHAPTPPQQQPPPPAPAALSHAINGLTNGGGAASGVSGLAHPHPYAAAAAAASNAAGPSTSPPGGSGRAVERSRLRQQLQQEMAEKQALEVKITRLKENGNDDGGAGAAGPGPASSAAQGAMEKTPSGPKAADPDLDQALDAAQERLRAIQRDLMQVRRRQVLVESSMADSTSNSNSQVDRERVKRLSSKATPRLGDPPAHRRSQSSTEFPSPESLGLHFAPPEPRLARGDIRGGHSSSRLAIGSGSLLRGQQGGGAQASIPEGDAFGGAGSGSVGSYSAADARSSAPSFMVDGSVPQPLTARRLEPRRSLVQADSHAAAAAAVAINANAAAAAAAALPSRLSRPLRHHRQASQDSVDNGSYGGGFSPRVPPDMASEVAYGTPSTGRDSRHVSPSRAHYSHSHHAQQSQQQDSVPAHAVSYPGDASASGSGSASSTLDPKTRRLMKKEEENRKREQELMEARRQYFEERKSVERKNRGTGHGDRVPGLQGGVAVPGPLGGSAEAAAAAAPPSISTGRRSGAFGTGRPLLPGSAGGSAATSASSSPVKNYAQQPQPQPQCSPPQYAPPPAQPIALPPKPRALGGVQVGHHRQRSLDQVIEAAFGPETPPGRGAISGPSAHVIATPGHDFSFDSLSSDDDEAARPYRAAAAHHLHQQQQLSSRPIVNNNYRPPLPPASGATPAPFPSSNGHRGLSPARSGGVSAPLPPPGFAQLALPPSAAAGSGVGGAAVGPKSHEELRKLERYHDNLSARIAQLENQVERLAIEDEDEGRRGRGGAGGSDSDSDAPTGGRGHPYARQAAPRGPSSSSHPSHVAGRSILDEDLEREQAQLNPLGGLVPGHGSPNAAPSPAPQAELLSSAQFQTGSAMERARALRDLCSRNLGGALFSRLYDLLRERTQQIAEGSGGGGGGAGGGREEAVDEFREELVLRLGSARVHYVGLIEQLQYFEDIAADRD